MYKIVHKNNNKIHVSVSLQVLNAKCLIISIKALQVYCM